MGKTIRRGFTLIELLVVIAIIGVLIGLLVPAVQRVRESAFRTQCQNNMRQLGVAAHNYYSQRKAFPSGTITSGGNNHRVASWAVSLLPFLEQDPMFKQLDLAQGFYDVNHLATVPLPNVDKLKDFAPSVFICPSSTLDVFTCPEDLKVTAMWGKHILEGNYIAIMGACNGPNDATEPGIGGTARVFDKRPAAPIQFHHGGIMATNGVIFHASKIRNEHITDGSSNTLMIGEQSDWGSDPGVGDPPTAKPKLDIRQTYRSGLWAGSNIEGMSAVTVRYPINTKARVNFQDGIARYGWNTPIQSAHTGGAFMLRCDGGAVFALDSTPFDVLKYLCVRDDQQTLNVEW